VKSTMVSGCRVSNRDTASGEDYIMTLILVSGLSLKRMGMECTPGRTEIATKVNGTCV
jgi:hypothetical protein